MKTIRELCEARDEIEAELHARATAAFPERHYFGGAPDSSPEHSLTILSRDGVDTLVRFYVDSFNRHRGNEMHQRFPGSHRYAVDAMGPIWGDLHILPLAVYERGESAIRALQAEKEAREQDEWESADRRRYEELKKRFAPERGSAKRERDLESVAKEMFYAIVAGRLGSIGAMNNTYLPQIDRREADRWRGRLDEITRVAEEPVPSSSHPVSHPVVAGGGSDSAIEVPRT